MKTKIFLSIIALGLVLNAFSQKAVNELIFTAINDSSYIQLDSIKIINRSQSCDTVIVWPDTVLFLTQVGLDEYENKEEVLEVFQNYPNPVKDHSNITIYLSEKENIILH